ncbi:MAG: hypothetical protein JXQ25_09390 [Deltaproteobacteria bacterium]|nr:hypothetical protein [Deltaproteobacteria bacterium]
MSDAVITAILTFMAIGLVGWFITRVRTMVDRHKVYKWLQSNTVDEPGESHVDTPALAKGTRLPEDRVRRACMTDQRIYHYSMDSDQWSVWRKEPQSVYEKRGALFI